MNNQTQQPHIQRVRADQPASKPGIDLQALAEEVLKLLKREMRLENERQGWQQLWK